MKDNSSTYGTVGDDSSYVNNLCDFNDHLKEKSDDETEKRNFNLADPIVTEKVVENGIFDAEDYPSIVEKCEIAESNATSQGSVFQTFNNDLSSLSDRRNSSYDDVIDNPITNISHMMSFQHPSSHTNPEWDSNDDLRDDEKPISANDAVHKFDKYDVDRNSNPFASIVDQPLVSKFDEKENADEKEIIAEKDDEIDFVTDFCSLQPKNQFSNRVHDFEKIGEKDLVAASTSDPPSAAIVEEVCVKDISEHEVGVGVLSETTNGQNQQDIARVERSLSTQIVDSGDFEPKQFSGEEVDRLEDVTVLSDNGDPDEPIRSVDVEAPYIHDCGRLDEKPDSVHHHPVPVKHYDDLLPDTSSTMESDKLESELRESLTKVENDFPVRQTEEEEITLSVPTSTQVEIVETSDEAAVPLPAPSQVAEAISAAADVAKSPVIAQLTKETKKAGVVMTKKADEKSKPTTKKSTGTTTSSVTKAKTGTNLTSLKPTTEPKKMPANVGKMGAAPNTSRPTSAATKMTAPRTTVAMKASPKSTTSCAVPARSTLKPASPTKPKLSATKPASAKSELSNGDAFSTKPLVSKRVPMTTSAPRKSTEASNISGATSKPAVNLSTRTSLAPKPRLVSKAEGGADKAKPAVTKRPLSTATKVTNKDTKDVANKRLSAAKSSPAKSVSITNGKTDFKSGPLKSTCSPLKKASPTAIKKPASAAPQPVTKNVDNQPEGIENQN